MKTIAQYIFELPPERKAKIDELQKILEEKRNSGQVMTLREYLTPPVESYELQRTQSAA